MTAEQVVPADGPRPAGRILNDRLPLLFTFALPAMLKFQFALSAFNGSARSELPYV
jgi:hypothetical protein